MILVYLSDSNNFCIQYIQYLAVNSTIFLETLQRKSLCILYARHFCCSLFSNIKSFQCWNCTSYLSILIILTNIYIYIYIYNSLWCNKLKFLNIWTMKIKKIKLKLIKGFRTIVFIFIVISTTFQPICPLTFRTGNPQGFNKEHSSKFREGSQVRQTPEEGWRTYRPKRCGNNNEDNRPKTLHNRNAQALSQKFRQLKLIFSFILGQETFGILLYTTNESDNTCF